MTYYNEFDPLMAAWLRELIARDLIAKGDVDERSVTDVSGDDLAGYRQCHFFAGIGGWSYALRLAGWPDDRPVWTGSCPCQPFSAAGKQKGKEDHRNLWPAFRRLIALRRPHAIFGEQVDGAAGFGWIDRVRTDLEKEAYAVGAVVLGAHSAGAPHIRQRLYWVAQSERNAREPGRFAVEPSESLGAAQAGPHAESGRCGVSDGLANAGCGADECGLRSREAHGETVPFEGETPQQQRGRDDAGVCSGNGFWSRYELVPCLDGTARRIESGTFPLAHGVPARVGRLRGYGNAIVPQVAAEFVRAFMELELPG